MSTCVDCYGTNNIEPCAEVGCVSTNYGKCVTYSGAGLFCSQGPINTFTYSGTAVAIVSEVTVVVSATGGSGSGATFSVTRGPSSTSYTVFIVNKGSSYAVGDTLTIPGTAVGGTSPANNISIAVTTLSALIDATYTVDDAIKNLHDRICNLTPSGLLYSGFNFACLRQGGNLESVGAAITTAQGFAESASAALCSLNTRVKAVETPTFTVPSCTVGLVSGTSTLGAILTEYGNVLCAISSGTGGISITGVTVPVGCTMTTQPASTASLGTWFDWVVDNICSITGTISSNLTTTNNNVSAISTFLGSTTRFNNSANCLTALGGTSSDSLHATIGYLTTKVCAIDTTVNAIPSYIKTDSVALNWVGCFGSAPYSFSNTATSIQTQLQRIVTVLNAEKTSYSGDFTVTTAPCGSKVVSLAAGAAFSCSSLASCSIGALGDVVITTPTDPHVLYYNGTNWVNKNINALVTVSSADSSVTITTTTTAGNVNFDLSVAANTPSRVTLTPLTVTNANNTFNPLYPALPGSGYPVATKQGILVSIQGSVELVSTGSFSLSNGTQIPLATLPAGYRPLAGTLSFLVTLFSKKTAPYQEPDSNPIIGRITIDTGGTLVLIPYPIFPAGSSLFTASQRVEIDLSQIQYSVMP
jgi:hypothetical protein